MSKDDNGKTSRLVIGLAASIVSIGVGIFMIGWNARGQTAKIKAIEVQTTHLQTDFDAHCITQAKETRETRQVLGHLKENEAAQTVILENIIEKLE